MNPPNRIEMEDLKRVLNEEIAVYQQLEISLSQKKHAIIQGDLNSLIQLDARIEQLSQHTKELDQKRFELMVRMGRGQDSLKTFISSLETGEDTEFLNLTRDRLTHTIDSIKTLSQTNRDLLTQSIRLIEQSVDFIANILAPEGPAYARTKANPRESQQAGTIGPSTVCRDV